MARGMIYDFSACNSKLEADRGVCTDCFDIVEAEKKRLDGKSKVEITKSVIEKISGRDCQELELLHCEDCVVVVKTLEQVKSATNQSEKSVIGNLVQRIETYKKQRPKFCWRGE